MHDLNDLVFFVEVVRHGGFSAAARATGIEKTRLSRRLAGLEHRLGVRLLLRNTRHVVLTEAGQRFYSQAEAVVHAAQGAFDQMEDLRSAPAGTVRMTCPQVMAQSIVAPLLPAFFARYPAVQIELHADDRPVDLLKERYDLALRAQAQAEASPGIVARELGGARRVLVASPRFLDQAGRPAAVQQLCAMATLARAADMHDGEARWELRNEAGERVPLLHRPRMLCDDLQAQMAAAIGGAGVALLPEPIVYAAVRAGELEILLPAWEADGHVIRLLYLPPRGMLPSVRCVIDHLAAHFPPRLQGRLG